MTVELFQGIIVKPTNACNLIRIFSFSYLTIIIIIVIIRCGAKKQKSNNCKVCFVPFLTNKNNSTEIDAYYYYCKNAKKKK